MEQRVFKLCESQVLEIIWRLIKREMTVKFQFFTSNRLHCVSDNANMVNENPNTQSMPAGQSLP